MNYFRFGTTKSLKFSIFEILSLNFDGIRKQKFNFGRINKERF